MRNHLFLFLFLFSASAAIKAQSRFNLYVKDSSALDQAQITRAGNKIFCAGARLSSSSQDGTMRLYQIDQQGSISGTVRYSAPQGYSISVQDIEPCADGGLIILSHISSPNNTIFLWNELIRTDSTGNILWNRAYKITNTIGYAGAVKQCSNGDFIFIVSATDSASTAPFRSLYMVRADSSGNPHWMNRYDITAAYLNYYRDIIETGNGDLLVCGGSSYNGIITKITAGGNLLWAKVYNGIYLRSIVSGGSGYIACGESNYQASVLKTDTAGNLLWQKIYPGPGLSEGLGKIVSDSSTGFAVAGFYRDGTGHPMPLLLHIASNGSQDWMNYYYDNAYTDVFDLVRDSDNGFLISGTSFNYNYTFVNTRVIKTNQAGDDLCNALVWPDQSSAINNTVTVSPVSQLALGSDTIFSITVSSYTLNDSTGCSNLSVTEKEDDSFQLFPNPGDGIVFLDHLPAAEMTLQVFDCSGRICKQEKITQQKIDLSALENGIYLLNFSDGIRNYSRRILILH